MSEEITSPIILKFDIPQTKLNDYWNLIMGFIEPSTPVPLVTIDGEGDFSPNSLVRDIVIYNQPHLPPDKLFARFDIQEEERRDMQSSWFDKGSGDTTLYVYINPKNHRIMYFKDGLTSSNVVLDYTGTEIPSSLCLTPPFTWGDSPALVDSYDTSLAGGNIIIPPANWQYA